MKKQLNNNAGALALIALVVALLGACIAGANAAGVIVSSKQIRNGSILTQDIHKGAVKTSDIGTSAVKSGDIGTSAVQSSDIGEGQVTPDDVTMPDPDQLVDSDIAKAEFGEEFGRLSDVGTYAKEAPDSLLQVDWTGSAAAGFAGCQFQIRVDGQASGPGAGVFFVANGGQAVSVASTALFSGLPTGAHTIEVWARTVGGGGAQFPCTIGPASAGIAQTFVVSEQVV